MASPSTVVREVVKETFKGSGAVEEPSHQLSAQSRARFNAHASRDPETGELFMGPDEFINAVAPENEDYVSLGTAHFVPLGGQNPNFFLTDSRRVAQNQAGSIFDSVSRR